jgi:leucyl-tRNA synthetase
MPIQAAANRLKREIESGKTRSEQPVKKEQPKVEEKGPAEKKEEVKGGKKGKAKATDKKEVKEERVPPTQYEILLQIGISEDEIPKFIESEHWLRFFPPEGKKDLIDFGISADWRRSFITTSINPFYDSFIQWQVNTMKANDKIFYGKKFTIFSELDNQPCADHDRSKGEGVKPQEYVGIKIKLLEFPDSIKEYAEKEVFLVAATLRPETMYGQTNCFVLPTAEYGLYEMKDNQYYIMSERAARNFAFQEQTVVER